MLGTAKYKVMLEAASATNGGTIVSSPIDTKGFSRARLIVWGTPVATDKPPTVLKLSEADSTTGPFTDIDTFTGGVGFTIPPPEGTQSDGTGKPYVVMDVTLDPDRKRYLRLTIQPSTTQTYYGVAELLKGEQDPDTNTERNVRAYVAG